MSEEIAPHVHFQYADARHKAETMISGMWLFLATEVLLFGGLLLA
jgi:cytochrome c oxidase subunit 3